MSSNLGIYSTHLDIHLDIIGISGHGWAYFVSWVAADAKLRCLLRAPKAGVLSMVLYAGEHPCPDGNTPEAAVQVGGALSVTTLHSLSARTFAHLIFVYGDLEVEDQ